ncbi:protein adenylyltransferase SelO [Vibrio maerlii]|uniref:protein adenylyltransferase SelO n=1 Tax=Vibrio maerlii TaxID=2231648 RepID=UPI000E3C9B08|nr:YdiU family protein [Vibrio maerlii]
MKDLLVLEIGHRFQQLSDAFYTLIEPQPLDNTTLVAWNSDLASQLNLPRSQAQATKLTPYLFGESIHRTFSPLAMKYAGHQFGVYNPDLGDGRGVLLGEVMNRAGHWVDLHLKGSGLTPYSRMGDGRAVLRSTIREYLCSEAMHGLGIPTTRALAMATSDTPVYREKVEQGAMLLRTASTHVRFGHFEHFFYTGKLTELKLLTDKVIDWYWPKSRQSENPYIAMFDQVVLNTARLIATWQASGFVHGVLNTDNMSILGETIDYGPFAFLDDYQPGFVSNHSDYESRYAFDQQPRIGLWNLTALANALTPLIDKQALETALLNYEQHLNREFSLLMRKKLGLRERIDGDGELFDEMFAVLKQGALDYTYFMRQLSELDRQGEETILTSIKELNTLPEFQNQLSTWYDLYIKRCRLEKTTKKQRCRSMRAVNPKYILRTYLAQQAIEKAEKGDFSEVNNLSSVLKNPFSDQHKYNHYAQLPSDWGKKLEISCSS